MTAKAFKEERVMENKRKMKLGAADRVILGTGYGLLGIFCILILIPLAYVVAASFMERLKQSGNQL